MIKLEKLQKFSLIMNDSTSFLQYKNFLNQYKQLRTKQRNINEN